MLTCNGHVMKYRRLERGCFNNPSLNPFLIFSHINISAMFFILKCEVLPYFLEIKEIHVVHAWGACSKLEYPWF